MKKSRKANCIWMCQKMKLNRGWNSVFFFLWAFLYAYKIKIDICCYCCCLSTMAVSINENIFIFSFFLPPTLVHSLYHNFFHTIIIDSFDFCDFTYMTKISKRIWCAHLIELLILNDIMRKNAIQLKSFQYIISRLNTIHYTFVPFSHILYISTFLFMLVRKQFYTTFNSYTTAIHLWFKLLLINKCWIVSCKKNYRPNIEQCAMAVNISSTPTNEYLFQYYMQTHLVFWIKSTPLQHIQVINFSFYIRIQLAKNIELEVELIYIFYTNSLIVKI